MHYKRQTVWIVSMLSLMVVLSAYYLFTDDINEFDSIENQWAQQMDAQTMTDESGDMTMESLDLEEQESLEDHPSLEDQQSMLDQPLDDMEEGTAQTEQEVLKQLEQQSETGGGYFAEQLMKRNEMFSKETERLLSIITDENQNAQAVTEAHEQLRKLEEKEAKITHLEELLMKDYPNAFITEENNKWKVVVQADKLEKSEAVTIVDTVVEQMNVLPWQIVVQYRP